MRVGELSVVVAAVATFGACSSEPGDTNPEDAAVSPAATGEDTPGVDVAPVTDESDAAAEMRPSNDAVPIGVPDLGDPPGWTDPSGARLRFVDATSDAGVEHRFSSGVDVPLEKDTRIMMGGVAAVDVDRDDDTDLFVLGGGNEADSLFLNDGTGSFEEVAAEVGLGELHFGSAVTAADYDGDGDVDLFVASHGDPQVGSVPGQHRLYRNELVPSGDLRFVDVAEDAGVAWTSRDVHDGFGSVFGDIDLDGDLDLVVAGWQRDGLGNRVFRNDGDGTFTDVTADSGFVDDGIRGFSPCLVDMTGDRLPELLLVADFGTTRYFVNDGSSPDSIRFAEQTERAGVGREYAGMGTATGDVDRDGRFDWYATAIYDADNVGRGDGNKLYLNRYGDPGLARPFLEISVDAGVDDGGWGWGAVFLDVNLDGRLDLFEVNGWDLPSYVGNLSRMWVADPVADPPTFDEVTAEAGPLHNRHGLSVAQLDLEGDGDRDLVVTSSNDEFRLYRNDLEHDRHWLRVRLDTTGHDDLAPHGLGAVVRVTADGVTQSVAPGTCANYNSVSELTSHVGLGSATVVDVVVEWPDGTTTEVSDLAADRTITITPDGVTG